MPASAQSYVQGTVCSNRFAASAALPQVLYCLPQLAFAENTFE
jgi:hypothetical protein